MKEEDHFKSKKIVKKKKKKENKLHLLLSNFSGGGPPDPLSKYVPPTLKKEGVMLREGVMFCTFFF